MEGEREGGKVGGSEEEGKGREEGNGGRERRREGRWEEVREGR